MQRIVDAVLLLLDLDLGGTADADHRDAAGELGEALLQLLAVVVGGRLLDLRLDLRDAALDVLLLAGAIDDRGLLLLDHHLLGAAEHLERDRLELDAEVLGDDLAAGQDGDVLEHGLAAVAEAGSLGLLAMETFLQQLINGLSLGAIYALIALGYTMVYGVLRLINFAHGDVYMLGAFAGYFLANALQLDENPSILGAIAVTIGAMAICAVVGILIERLAYRPVRHHSRLTSLITAIGVSLLLEYGGQVVFGATPRFFPQMIRSETYALGGVQITNQSLLIIVVVARRDVRAAVHRPPHEDGQGDARDVLQPVGGEADGHQHGPRHRVHVRARLGAGGGRRRDGRAGHSAHRPADGPDDRPQGVRRRGARRHRQHSRRDGRRAC